MPLYFYHYTSEAAYKAMTLDGTLPTNVKPFVCKPSQPQKWLEFKIQHPKGFYVTCMSPDQMDATTKRKVGGSAKDGKYVLVFQFEVKEASFKAKKKSTATDLPGAVSASIKWVGSPCKYVITNTGKQKSEDGMISFTSPQCIWAGPTDDLPADFSNNDETVKRLKNPG